jgi:hypothetical protein
MISRVLVSATLLTGVLTIAAPAEASAYTHVQSGEVQTLSYTNLSTVANYRTETRSGADWLIIDLFYGSARANATVRVGRGMFESGSADYVVNDAGLTRSNGSTTATGSRNPDGHHFHFEIPTAEAAATGTSGGLTFIFAGAGQGVYSFAHPIPDAAPATVTKALYDQCKADLRSIRTQLERLQAKTGTGGIKTK